MYYWRLMGVHANQSSGITCDQVKHSVIGSRNTAAERGLLKVVLQREGIGLLAQQDCCGQPGETDLVGHAGCLETTMTTLR